MKKHYHVLCGLVELYMPDDVSPAYTSYRAAAWDAVAQKRAFNDSAWCGADDEDRRAMTYTGDLYRHGFAVDGAGNNCIEISECYEDDCFDEDGEPNDES